MAIGRDLAHRARLLLLGVLPGASGGTWSRAGRGGGAGWSGGDGEVLLDRLVAPALVLAAGIPGGAISSGCWGSCPAQPSGPMPDGGCRPSPTTTRSESPAPVKQDEDHRRAGQGDQGQGGEIGDQVDVDAHECRRDDVKRWGQRKPQTSIQLPRPRRL